MPLQATMSSMSKVEGVAGSQLTGTDWFWGPTIPVPVRWQRGVLCAQCIPGIERYSKVDAGGTFGSLQHLQWVVYEVFGWGREEGSAVGLSLQHLPSPSKPCTPHESGSSAAPCSSPLFKTPLTGSLGASP